MALAETGKVIQLSPQSALYQSRAGVTGSAKKGHNRTSLNLQYKALNTLGEILAYY